MQVDVVVENIHESDKGVITDFVGVYTSKELAGKACLSCRHGYGPAVLDEDATDEESSDWDGFVYPHANDN